MSRERSEMANQLCKEDVNLGPIQRECSECGDKAATVYICVDLGYMITGLGDAEYCNDCGRGELERLRELLPEREESADVSCQHCSVCEGADHHWMPDSDDEVNDGEPFMICKHCSTTRPMRDNDDTE